MPLIVVNNPEDHIWDHNPSLQYVSPFGDLKKETGDVLSSRIITAIYLIWDPKSELRDSGMTDDEIKEDVTKNYLNDPDFNWDEFDHIKQAYLDKNISKIERLFLRYEADLLELDRVLGEWLWDKSDAKERADLVKKYKELFEDYITLKEKVDTDKKSASFGGYRKSITENYADTE